MRSYTVSGRRTIASVHVRRVDDAARFLAEAGPLLIEDEARHNLILGVAGTVAREARAYDACRAWIAEDGERPVAAALQTPPFNVLVAQPRLEKAMEDLVERIAGDGALPGVTAALPEADAFAALWEPRAGVRRRARMRQLVYRLTSTRPPVGVSGRPRVATDEDRPLLVDWVGAFTEETLGRASLREPEETVDLRLRDEGGGFALWENPDAVSLVGFGSRTPNGIRIGPVYTPPEHRRHGYASALTASVSAEQLASGKRFCFLYTDASNPTANHVYTAIGYEQVCESVEYAFDPA
jgi:uncharacterized protein